MEREVEVEREVEMEREKSLGFLLTLPSPSSVSFVHLGCLPALELVL